MKRRRCLTLMTEVEREPEYAFFRETMEIFKFILDITNESIEIGVNKSLEYLQNNPKEFPFFLSFLDRFLDIRPLHRRFVLQILKAINNSDFEDKPYIMNYMLNQPFLKILLVKSKIFNDEKISSNPQYDDYIDVYKAGTLESIIKEDDLESLQQIVLEKTTFDFNQQGIVEFECPMSILDIAVFYGASRIFKYLLLNDAKLSTLTPAFAISNGNPEIIHALEQCDIKFDNVLKYSVQYHQYRLSDWLLQHFECEKLTLADCIERLNIEAFLFYIINGENPEEVSAANKTPIHSVCQCASLAWAKFLIEQCHVNKEARDKYGVTTLHMACSNDALYIVKYLIDEQGIDKETKSDENATPLHYACWSGCLPIVQVLMEKYNVEKEPIDTYGYTPLHLACTDGHIEIAKYLIEKQNANIYAKDINGLNTLHIVCACNFMPLVQYLVEEKNFNLDIGNADGNTPLHYACQELNTALIVYLVNHHATVNAKNATLETPLHMTCEYGGLEETKFLCQNGADVNAKDSNGDTPLHFACRNGNTQIAKFLIEEMKANIEDRNNDCKTALHMACLSSQLDIVKYLIEECHANINVHNDNGQSFLNDAATSENQLIPQYLIHKISEDMRIKSIPH